MLFQNQTLARRLLGTGVAAKRDIDQYLSRSSSRWQVSQPRHLRHLSIIRDTTVVSKSPIYIHYTFENFQRLVDSGEKRWDAVSMMKVGSKTQGCTVPAIDHPSELGEDGFPVLNAGKFLGPRNDATLAECTATIPSSRELHLPHPSDVKLKANTNGPPSDKADESRPGVSFPFEKTKPTRKRSGLLPDTPKSTVTKGRGRPRKIKTDALPQDISSWKMEDILRAERSLRAAEKYQKSKIVTEIENRIEAGQDSATAARAVLEETNDGLQRQGAPSLSTFIISEVLHRFAGEPLLAAEENASTRLRKQIVKATGSGDMKVLYQPSVTAHSSNFAHQNSLDPLSGIDKRRRLGRPSKTVDILYQPSMAAHTGKTYLMPLQKAKSKRLRTTLHSFSRLSELTNVGDPQESSSTAPKISRGKQTKNEIGKNSQTGLILAKKVRIPLEAYEQISQSINRTSNGVFLGATGSHSESNRKSQFKKSIPFKLGIFRLPGLIRLDWFSQSDVSAASSDDFNMVTFAETPRSERNNQESSRDPLPTSEPSSAPLPDQSSSPIQQEETAGAKELYYTSSQTKERLNRSPELQHSEGIAEPSEPVKQLPVSVGSLSTHAANGSTSFSVQDVPTQIPAATVQPRSPNDGPVSGANAGLLVGTVQPPPNPAEVDSQQSFARSFSEPLEAAFPVNGERGVHLNSINTPDPRPERSPIGAPTDAQSSPSPEVSAEMLQAAPPPKKVEVPLGQMSPENQAMETSVQGTVDGEHEMMSNQRARTKATPLKARSKLEADDPSIFRRMYRTDGSAAMMRREIVMHILRNCGGVCPGPKALSIPFNAEWKARGHFGNPDNRTVRTAVNDLMAAGRLHLVVFSFKSRSGLTVTTDLIAASDISMGDQRIRDVQKAMAQRHPSHYIPLAAMPDVMDVERAAAADQMVDEEMSSGPMMDIRVLQDIERNKERERKQSEQQERMNTARSMRVKNPQERAAYISSLHSSELDKTTIVLLTKLAQPIQRAKRLQSIRNPRPPQSSHTPIPPVEHIQETERGNHCFPQSRLRDLDHSMRRHAFSAGDSIHEAAVMGQIHEWRAEVLRRAAQIEQSQGLIPAGENNHQPNEIASSSQHRSDAKLTIKDRPHSKSHLTKMRKRVHDLDLKAYGTFETISPTFMDPTHRFHAASGTFSASFSGFRHGKLQSRTRVRQSSTKTMTRPRTAQLPVGWVIPLALIDYIGKDIKEIKRPAKTPPFDDQVDRVLQLELEGGYQEPHRNEEWPIFSYKFPSVQQTHPRVQVDMDESFLMIYQHADDAGEIASATSLKAQEFMRRYARRAMPRSPTSTLKGDKRLQRDTHVVLSNSKFLDRMIGPPNRRKRKSAQPIDADVDERGIGQSTNINLADQPSKKRKIQRTRNALPFTNSEERRLVVAVTAVRVLTGGLGLAIEWPFVGRVFEPNYSLAFVKAKWRSMSNRFKSLKARVESDFQILFINAYERGEVPTLNYDRLEDYDWKWLVSWMFENLDTAPDDAVPDLPATREQLDKTYRIAETGNEPNLNEFYEIDGPTTRARRFENLSHHAHVCSLATSEDRKDGGQHQNKDISNELTQAGQLAKARTYIRANTATRESKHDAASAHDKLVTFEDSILELALKTLLQDRIIEDTKKGKHRANRNHVLCAKLTSYLKRPISVDRFRNAIDFKTELDSHFFFQADNPALPQGPRSFRWDPARNDGAAMALFNLQVSGMLKLVPVDVPMNEWGQLDDGSYATRQMNKSRLDFSVDLLPTSTYRQGNPITERFEARDESVPPPPRSRGLGQDDLIPLWIDIHGNLIPDLWELSVSAVTGSLASRPGASAREIETILKPGLEVWEIELMLRWMTDVGIAQTTSKGHWQVAEWWWMGLEVVDMAA